MKNNNKVSFFIPSLRGGGAERIFVTLANEFAKRGVVVDLILAQKEGPYLKDVLDEVNIVNLRAKRVLFSLFPLIKYLKKEKPKTIISALSHVNVAVLLAKIIARSSVNVIVTEHSTLSAAQSKYFFLKRIVIEKLIKIGYKKAAAVVFVSSGGTVDFRDYLDYRENNLSVIYNPIDIDSIVEMSKEMVEHKWFNNKDVKTVLGVGRLTEPKDLPTLIKAFKEAKKDNNTKLIILGEGEDRADLEGLIKELKLEDSVDLYGFVDNPYSYMAKASVFVLSSKHEGLPTVLIEAMACGTQVISTDCPSGPAEILENGKYGRLVGVGDVNALAKEIEDAINDLVDTKELQQRAKYFSVERATEKYLKLISDCQKSLSK